MSLIYKCDICGKNSTMTNVTFSAQPMVMMRENSDGRMMRVYLEIAVEDNDDYYMIDDTLKNLSINGQLTSQKDIAAAIQTMPLKNKNPMICDMCKKELATDILTKAQFPLISIDDIDYSTLAKPTDFSSLENVSDEELSDMFNSSEDDFEADENEWDNIFSKLQRLRDEDIDEES